MLHTTSGRRRQSVDCARGAELDCGSCRPLQRFSRDSRTAGWNVGINGHAKRLELRCDRQSASGNIDGGDVGS